MRFISIIVALTAGLVAAVPTTIVNGVDMAIFKPKLTARHHCLPLTPFEENSKQLKSCNRHENCAIADYYERESTNPDHTQIMYSTRSTDCESLITTMPLVGFKNLGKCICAVFENTECKWSGSMFPEFVTQLYEYKEVPRRDFKSYKCWWFPPVKSA